LGLTTRTAHVAQCVGMGALLQGATRVTLSGNAAFTLGRCNAVVVKEFLPSGLRGPPVKSIDIDWNPS